MDRKRDAPIPWSVSLPCVAAVVALALGWRDLGQRPLPEPKSVIPAPSVAPAPKPVSIPAPTPAPKPTPPVAPPTPTSTPSPALAPAPAKPTVAPVAKELWVPLSKFSADGSDETVERLAVAAVARMRDQLGPDAARYFVRAEPSSRVLVVTSARGCSDRGDQLIRFLAPFGARLDALVVRPAKIDPEARSWVAVNVSEDDPTPLGIEYFAGFTAGASDDVFDMGFIGRAAGKAQMRRMLRRGPDGPPLEWLIVGAVGAAASESLADAVRFRDPRAPSISTGLGAPIPSLSELLQWGTEEAWIGMEDSERRAALATSFVAFCLVRGPKDPRAAGLFELLRSDGRSLPQEPAARDAEIAARLGATRLDEIEAAWKAARR